MLRNFSGALFKQRSQLLHNSAQRIFPRVTSVSPAVPTHIPTPIASNPHEFQETFSDIDVDIKNTSIISDNDINNDEHLQTPLSSFRLSKDVVKGLERVGIKSLFPVQSVTLDAIVAGKDLIAKAKTGTGKTLAFSIGIMERLLQQKSTTQSSSSKRRQPRALILCPTRELAKQVHNEIQRVAPPQLVSVCVYGGVSYGPQTAAIDKGADIVVGTPGRILDLIKTERLPLSSVKTLCLDEADHMLDVGFEKEMDAIISALQQAQSGDSVLEDSETGVAATRQYQTLLFSATMPRWVRHVQQKYLRPGNDQVFIDLVGDGESQSVSRIKYMAIACQSKFQIPVLTDLLQLHGADKRVLVFADTKTRVDETHQRLQAYTRAAALHGDISQGVREQTLQAFRRGTVSCVIATDVAARGLDVPDVDIVVQLGPPERLESFVHRSGRTARAGKSGICITLYDIDQDSSTLNAIEQRAKIEIERIPPPQGKDIMQRSVELVKQRALEVQPEIIALLRPHASQFLSQLRPEDAIAALLASGSFVSSIKDRSAITGAPGKSTIKIAPLNQGSPNINNKMELKAAIERALSSADSSSLIDYRTAIQIPEERGFLVDVSSELKAELITKLSTEGTGFKVDHNIATLPRLVPDRKKDDYKRDRNQHYAKNKRHDSDSGKRFREIFDDFKGNNGSNSSDRFGKRATSKSQYRPHGSANRKDHHQSSSQKSKWR